MLQAIEAVTGALVPADEARREARYLCPGCAKLVGLRLGAHKIPHFAHFSRTLCKMALAESPRHQALKWLCKKFFTPLRVDWEVRLGERKADAVVEGLFAIECQSSPISVQEWQARTENHNSSGFSVMWLWDIKRVCGKNTFDEASLFVKSGRPVCLGPEIRCCHDESRGFIFVADKHTILKCRLSSLSIGEQAAAKKAGSPAARFWPQSLRKITLLPEFDKGARNHFASCTKKLLLVRFGEP